MARGKYEVAPKKLRVAAWILVVLVLFGALIGTSAAYLSASTEAVANKLEISVKPTLTIGEDNSIKVENSGYAVYLRGTVTVNWVHQDTGHLLAQLPQEGTDYELTPGTGWELHDGFYYYDTALRSGAETAPMVTLTQKTTKNGYRLELKVMAQTIQAVGQTDGDAPVDAILDAWGVQP